jgi:putative DNA primase/helicase
MERKDNIDKDALKHFIAGREMNLAQQMGIIGEGKANNEEHHQPCPLDGCASDDDGFYIRKDGSFHCRVCGFNGDLFALVMKHRNVEFPAALQIVADAAGYVGDKPKTKKRTDERKTSHVYHGEDGKEVYRIIRTDYTDEQGKPGKTFCPAYQDENGKTVFREYGVHYPYRLPDVLQTKTLFIVEGEKCADALNGVLQGAGLKNTVATTSQGGSQRGSLWKEILQLFPTIADKTIRILPDHDSPGMKYAQAVATAILESNPSADVKIVELPGLPPKGDVCDWIADLEMNGKDESACIETLSALCINAEPVTAETIASWSPSEKPESAKPGKKIIGGCFADVKDEPIDWLWTGRFAYGHLHQIHGLPDSGKGYFTFWLASIVSRGGTFPDNEICKKGSVLIVGTEEHAGYAKRKLSAQNADMRNVHYVTGYAEGDSEFPVLLTNTDIIQSACDELKKAGLPVSLIIVDPILQMLGVDPNDNGKTQAALALVKEFAERNNICFLCVNHDGKGQQATAAQRAIGATAIMGKMRIGYTAKKELKTSETEYPAHTLAVSKFNIGRRPRGITFRIVAHPNDPEIGKVEILDIDGDFTADDRTETVENKFDQCCQWLREFLSPGTTLQSAVETAAAENGFSRSTLKRAKKQCGVVSKKHQFSGQWEWTLPEETQAHVPPFESLRESLRGDTENSSVCEEAHPPENPEGTQAEGVSPFGENDHFSTLSEFDKFADSPTPESPPVPAEVRCPNCVHHRPNTYPTQGLCGEGYCQQDLPCHDYKIAKTENVAG